MKNAIIQTIFKNPLFTSWIVSTEKNESDEELIAVVESLKDAKFDAKIVNNQDEFGTFIRISLGEALNTPTQASAWSSVVHKLNQIRFIEKSKQQSKKAFDYWGNEPNDYHQTLSVHGHLIAIADKLRNVGRKDNRDSDDEEYSIESSSWIVNLSRVPQGKRNAVEQILTDVGFHVQKLYPRFYDKPHGRHRVRLTLHNADLFFTCLRRLEDISVRENQATATAFLMGAHPHAGQNSSIYKNLVRASSYDRNLLIELFGFLGKTKAAALTAQDAALDQDIIMHNETQKLLYTALTKRG